MHCFLILVVVYLYMFINIQKVRKKLAEKHTRCIWCGKPTKYTKTAKEFNINKFKGIPNLTVDHLLSKFSLLRGRQPHQLMRCCDKCNNERGRLEQEYVQWFLVGLGVTTKKGCMQREERQKLLAKHHFHMPMINPVTKITIFWN